MKSWRTPSNNSQDKTRSVAACGRGGSVWVAACGRGGSVWEGGSEVRQSYMVTGEVYDVLEEAVKQLARQNQVCFIFVRGGSLWEKVWEGWQHVR